MKVVMSMERRADAGHVATAVDAARAPLRPLAAGRWRSLLRPLLWLVALGVVGIGAYLNKDRLLPLMHAEAGASAAAKPQDNLSKGPWDGLVTMPAESQSALGLTTTAVL